MTEELNQQLAPIEEKMTQELVKANVTEAVISTLRERYLPLKIAGLEDKETYLLVKEGRKECKSLRVMAKKICTNGREEATAIQKAWIAKEKEVTGKIAEVEDYLEAQEKEYEAGIAAEKEARKRKQEEQLILRQQELTSIGVLYADGNFSLGDVSFELSAIKESDNDIWNETIWPLYKQAYEAIEADRIEQERVRKEMDAELKREKGEYERKRKELEEKEAELKREAERQAAEAQYKKNAQIKARQYQITTLGFRDNGTTGYVFRDFVLLEEDIRSLGDEDWGRLIARATEYVEVTLKDESEQKRKEQERIDLQNKRYAELLPYKEYGDPVDTGILFQLANDEYENILESKKAAFDKSEQEKAKRIADEAARAERERIEEEQRQAEVKRKLGLRAFRIAALSLYDYCHTKEDGDLGEMSDEKWFILITGVKEIFEDTRRKQEEERKAEELAQAGDKEKWKDIMDKLNAIDVHSMRSSQYRKKAAILREKLEEIKAL